MIMLNNAEKTSNKSKNADLVFSTILQIHKQLKEIAKLESTPKTKYNIADLSEDKLLKIKNFESSLEICLVAYEADYKLFKQKIKILNDINLLLDNYLKIGRLKDTTEVRYISTDEFSGFFEQ